MVWWLLRIAVAVGRRRRHRGEGVRSDRLLLLLRQQQLLMVLLLLLALDVGNDRVELPGEELPAENFALHQHIEELVQRLEYNRHGTRIILRVSRKFLTKIVYQIEISCNELHHRDSCHLVCNNRTEQLRIFSENIVIHFAKVLLYFLQCCRSGSRILDPNFIHPGSASKNLSILTPKHGF